jgi:hypothetical protein
MKIAYDLTLLAMFRHVRPEEEDPPSARGKLPVRSGNIVRGREPPAYWRKR